MRRILVLACCSILGLAACGGSDGADSSAAETPPAGDVAGGDPDASPNTDEAAGIVRVSPAEAAAVIADPPPGLVILDVRTAEEFAEARIDGATMLDFYRDDFADALAADFDPDVPYVLYCRSGNRSGQALEIMRDLGFTDVRDVDGGIVSWVDAGLPVVSG